MIQLLGRFAASEVSSGITSEGFGQHDALPAITIVTASYNQGRFLEKAIQSIRGQRYARLQYIIMDGGSTDDTADVVKRNRDIVDVFVSERDGGVAVALNRGFARATGDILFYLNSDDFLLPGALHSVAECFARSSAGVIYAHGIMTNEWGGSPRVVISDPWQFDHYLLGAVTVFQQSTFFRRSLFERTRGFNETNRTCWDGELLVDLALSGATFASVDRLWGGFRVHAGSITGSGRLAQRYRIDKRAIRLRALGMEPSLWAQYVGIPTVRLRNVIRRRLKRHQVERTIAAETLASAKRGVRVDGVSDYAER